MVIVYYYPTEPPEGYFRVDFMERRSSEYSSKFTFRSGLLQENIVCYKLYDDPDRMHEAQELVVTSPASHYPVFSENPLHLGFYLHSIEKGIIQK